MSKMNHFGQRLEPKDAQNKYLPLPFSEAELIEGLDDYTAHADLVPNLKDEEFQFRSND